MAAPGNEGRSSKKLGIKIWGAGVDRLYCLYTSLQGLCFYPDRDEKPVEDCEQRPDIIWL